jgi:uncharacterized protein involved in exopolysaccharide biosynthesis
MDWTAGGRMPATHNKPVATEESLRFTLHDLATPILRRKGTLSVTFLLVVSITLLLGHIRFPKYQAQSTILAAGGLTDPDNVQSSPSGAQSYQAALTDAKTGVNTIIGPPGSQSLNEADLDREAKLDEQNYLLYLSTREHERAEDMVANHTIPHATIAVPSSIPLLPAHSSAVIILIAIILGLLIGLSLTYIVDYGDPCFHSPVQVIRTLRIPLVVAIPKRTL